MQEGGSGLRLEFSMKMLKQRADQTEGLEGEGEDQGRHSALSRLPVASQKYARVLNTATLSGKLSNRPNNAQYSPLNKLQGGLAQG